MSKMTKDESIERIQENLGKLVDVAQSCIGADSCHEICKYLRQKGERNWNKKDKKLWCKCGECKNL